MKFFQNIFLLSLFLIPVMSCTTITTEKNIIKKTETPAVHETILIEPSRMYEECIELLPTHSMEYSFKTSKPVKFNIHYHREDHIHYPVFKDNITEWNGVLKVSEQHYYTEEQEYFCLMWENPHNESVSLTFECKIRDR